MLLLANRDDSKFKDIKNKKGLNIATRVFAGATTGTSFASATISGVAMGKLNKNVENFDNCDKALSDSFLLREVEYNILTGEELYYLNEDKNAFILESMFLYDLQNVTVSAEYDYDENVYV